MSQKLRKGGYGVRTVEVRLDRLVIKAVWRGARKDRRRPGVLRSGWTRLP